MPGSHNHNFRNFFCFPNQVAKAVLHKQVLHTRQYAVVWSNLCQNNPLHQHFRKTSTFPHSFKWWLVDWKINRVWSPNYGLFFLTGSFEICLGPHSKPIATLIIHLDRFLPKKRLQKPLNIFQISQLSRKSLTTLQFWQDSAASRVVWHLLHGWNWGVLLPGGFRSLCTPQAVWRKQFHPQLATEPGT